MNGKLTAHFFLSFMLASAVSAAEPDVLDIVLRYQNVWDSPPSQTPAPQAVDGILFGNGDMKVVLTGSPDNQQFYLGKNDLWLLRDGYQQGSPVPFGYFQLMIPALKGGSYHVSQSLRSPCTEAVFKKDGLIVRQRSVVLAQRNLLWVHLEGEGGATDVVPVVATHVGKSKFHCEYRDGLLLGTRKFEPPTAKIASGVAVAVKMLGAQWKAPGPEGCKGVYVRIEPIRLEPGKPVDFLVVMDSLFDSKDYEARVQRTAAALAAADLPGMQKAHDDWWAQYWRQSWVDIGDPELEHAYYRSLYGMGACSRNPRFPPGIFGWVTTDTPRWQGNYHLNYNHVAPYYALYSGNRLEQADPEDAPLLDFIPRGQWYAKNVCNTRGVLYPVGIGPLGIETTKDCKKYAAGGAVQKGGLFHHQKSDAAYSLVNIAQRWRCTYDLDYAKKVYPLVVDVANFWEDYLKFEPFDPAQGSEGRYVIYDDAIAENSGHDTNPIISLGMVKNSLDLAVDMSRAMGIDQARHEKWNHILTHLSEWPTQTVEGKTIFRLAEKGPAGNPPGSLSMHHVYPGNGVVLDSDPKWRAIALDTLKASTPKSTFFCSNGSNSYFPLSVRLGYDADIILGHLRLYAKQTYPNGFRVNNPHGIENLSPVPNTINEMLCMSAVAVGDPTRPESLLRLFPVWPKDKNARFVNIRTWGAFLVSAELKGGVVSGVKIVSERGRDCMVLNPWPGKAVQVIRNGSTAEGLPVEALAKAGERFIVKTKPGETIELRRKEI